MRIRILPYKQGSRSAKVLAEALGGKVLKLEGSTFKPKPADLLINWGSSMGPCSTWVWKNPPGATSWCSNKLNFFNRMKEECPDVIPEFWTDKDAIPTSAFPIVCRTILSGHSGAGIVMADQPSVLCPAPLYVSYVKKKDEYRVHLGKRVSEVVVIATQRKAVPTGTTPSDWQVRNHCNGFIFVRSNVHPPQGVMDAASRAFVATGLDFGAVDVIWNEQKAKAYVLEINTAPGLEGQTITDYSEFFKTCV